MPWLDEISYSQDECLAAIYDYFKFITAMFLDEAIVKYPPPGGWPSITPENMQSLGKNDKVISLLRHMPYIERGLDAQALPSGFMADWHGISLQDRTPRR